MRADTPPLLLLHGLKDKTAGPDNALNLTQALTALGAPVTADYYPEAGHADLVAAFSIPARRRVPVLQTVHRFLEAQPHATAE